MGPFSLPSLRFQPVRYKPVGIGYWSGHIPFACDLIYDTEPRVLVELGTHYGESYFAFCQAIKESGADCRAYAVDTWAGDEHTGAYGEEVFEDVDGHNREHYADFSRLLPMPFDEAVARFGNESIDVLHIDGAHTYEAVKQDFGKWWPKVKPGGVVLMHDSVVREHDFGVWKLLAELRGRFPVAEFVHSNGLGVVEKPGGGDRDGLRLALFGTGMPDGGEKFFASVRRYYEVCADHLEQVWQRENEQRPAEWSVTTNLYWRAEGEDFRESASVRRTHTVTAAKSRIVMKTPLMAQRPAKLRIDLAERPVCFTLHGVTVRDGKGDLLWELSAKELLWTGLKGLATPDGDGLLVMDAPAGASFQFAVPEQASMSLRDGGAVEIELAGWDPFTFASQVAEACRYK